MKISPISFKSTYIVTEKNNTPCVFSRMYRVLKKCPQYVKMYDSSQNDTFSVSLVTNDKNDDVLERYLKREEINFVKLTKDELLSEESIKKRIFVPNGDYPSPMYLPNPVFVDTKKFDERYHDDRVFYISSYDSLVGLEKTRSDKVIDYMCSGLPFKVPEVYLSSQNGVTQVNFKDGRHRYAIMRDLGYSSIPVAMGIQSYKIAEKAGLLKL